jgi:phosphatidylserine/phosphatidylglycerophosphate/cardiolipin synthase-like enzyme
MNKLWVLGFLLCFTFFGQYVWSRQKKATLVDQLQKAVEPVLVKAPQDLEVCFSPDEPCDTKLVKFIDSAEKSLDIAIYDITLDQIVHHVLVKSKKIPVRIIVDQRQSKGNHSLVGTLVKGGANLRYGRQRGIMHNKFVIVDGKALETGSFNYSNNATRSNQENQVYLWNPAIVDRYKQQFEKMWSNAKTP